MSTYPIDPDVRRIAKRFGVPAEWVAAVIRQEGGNEAIVRAVQCSVTLDAKRDFYEQAVEITCRSAVGAMARLIQSRGLVADWVEVFGAKWAPVGAENDPKGLNTHWVPNIQQMLNVVPQSRASVGPDVPGGGAI